jgi:uncharacterized protein (DUF58 family)
VRWWRRFKRWATPPRRLSLTRAGKFMVLLTLGVGLGALNTGNNLLFLLEGMMLALILASGVLSEISLRRLDARRTAPRRLHAESPAPGAFEVTADKRTPSFNITVHEALVRCVDGPESGEEIAPPEVGWWKFWKSIPSLDEAGVPAVGHMAYLDPNDSCEVPARWTFPTRGSYELSGIVLSTRFPFGLFEKSCSVDEESQLWVFPAVEEPGDWSGAISARFGDIPAGSAGQGADFFGLRDFREGDDPRRIHWKSSARRGDLVLQEFEEERHRAVEIFVVTSSGHDAPVSESERRAFERGLRRLTGLLGVIVEWGWRVGLATSGGRVAVSDASEAQLVAMLRRLSVVSLEPGVPGRPPTADAEDDEVGRIVVGLPAGVRAAGLDADLELMFEELQGAA